MRSPPCPAATALAALLLMTLGAGLTHAGPAPGAEAPSAEEAEETTSEAEAPSEPEETPAPEDPAAPAPAPEPEPAPPPEPEPEKAADAPSRPNPPERIAWLQDAGVGLVVRWGLGSQLGDVGTGSLVGASGDFLHKYFNLLSGTFNPKRFDPEDIAVLARLAGAKYVVFPVKDRTGFCLWETDTSDFHIGRSRGGGDLLGRAVAAFRAEGLAVGFHYTTEDYRFRFRHRLPVGPAGVEGMDRRTARAYRERVRGQVGELLDRFGRIDLLVIDGAASALAAARARELHLDLVIHRAREAAGEGSGGGGGAGDTVGLLPDLPPPGPAKRPVGPGRGRGTPSATAAIEALIAARAQGDNHLFALHLNPDGSVPQAEERLLREVAVWTLANEEAVTGVRPWTVSREGPIWLTRRRDAGTVYAFVTGAYSWSPGQRKSFLLRSVRATDATRVSVLGQGGRSGHGDPKYAPRWNQRGDALHLSVVRSQQLDAGRRWINPLCIRISGAAESGAGDADAAASAGGGE